MIKKAKDEDGQITILVIGFVLLSLLLISVVAGASSLYIAHKKLLSVADSAALAGADTFSLQGSASESEPSAQLNGVAVVRAAQAYIESAPLPDSVTGVYLDAGSGSPDGHTAEVTLTGVVHPLFVSIFVPAGITLTVTSTARAQLVQ